MNIKFKIESIDTKQGTCLVRYINPYGAIVTGAKTLADFELSVDVPTGNYLPSGAPETKPQIMLSTDNPNDDIVCSVSIMDSNGVPVDPAEIPTLVAKQYPTKIFESRKALASTNMNYSELLNRDFTAELVLGINNAETGEYEAATPDTLDLALLVQTVKSVN